MGAVPVSYTHLEFDGHEIDFDEAMARSATYKDFERHAYEETCNLFKAEVK